MTVCWAGGDAVVGAVGALPQADSVIVPNNSIERTRMSRLILLKGSELTHYESSATRVAGSVNVGATLEPSSG